MNKKPIKGDAMTTHQILYKIFNKLEAERIAEEKELKTKKQKD